MKLRNFITIRALRTTARLGWTVAGWAQNLAALGVRLEEAVDRHADKRGIDVHEVLEPLAARRAAA